jgi:hypothetical protein
MWTKCCLRYRCLHQASTDTCDNTYVILLFKASEALHYLGKSRIIDSLWRTLIWKFKKRWETQVWLLNGDWEDSSVLAGSWFTKVAIWCKKTPKNENKVTVFTNDNGPMTFSSVYVRMLYVYIEERVSWRECMYIKGRRKLTYHIQWS